MRKQRKEIQMSRLTSPMEEWNESKFFFSGEAML